MAILQFLHEAGWVHRNLSTSNIFVSNGQVKLADFEYAKRLDDQADAHEIRTGTANFISVEVDRQEYFFASTSGISTMELAARLQAEDNALQTLQQELLQSDVVFRYNPMHDFESLWWISVHILFNKRVDTVNGKIPPLHNHQKQQLWAASVFYGLASRQSALSAGNTNFRSAIKTLCPDLHRFGIMVNALRGELLKRYMDIEADISNLHRHTTAGEIPRQFIMGFDFNVSAEAVVLPALPEGRPETMKGGPAAASTRISETFGFPSS
ncbi:uncharacterized protein FIBRA_08708 [Fibroporia radiculosa]|uniref:Protein kinase domain-containing protein n=1 Tax=Fibroporia radiculosa TaxID=599839 RepID=J4GXA5_9APHY|nr:uncharacterized protein FIBRA_08708 [Fibroporia radiculosa]CCM06445.1 predicted protein [Fibroporia radiculosa]